MSGFFDVMSNLAGSFVNGYARGAALRRGHSLLERLCAELGWGIDERQDNKFYLDFKGKSGLMWRVSLTDEDEFVRFLVVSPTTLPPEDRSIKTLAYLLLRNLKLPFGAWVASGRDDDTVVLALLYRALAAGLTAETMKVIINTMIAEVEEVETKLQA